MKNINETPILLENTLKPIKVQDYKSGEQVIIRKMKLETIRQIDNICKKVNNRSLNNREFNELLDLTNAQLDQVLAKNHMNYMLSRDIIKELKN
jgi:hypothetical protein